MLDHKRYAGCQLRLAYRLKQENDNRWCLRSHPDGPCWQEPPIRIPAEKEYLYAKDWHAWEIPPAMSDGAPCRSKATSLPFPECYRWQDLLLGQTIA